MKLKHLFAVNIFFAVVIGAACVFFTGWLIRQYGLVPDAASIWTTRLAGGSLLGFASLMGFGLRTESRGARRAIALALLIQDGVGCAASLMIRLPGSVIGYGLLALGYAYFLFVKPSAS